MRSGGSFILPNRISPSCRGEARLNGCPASSYACCSSAIAFVAELAALRGEQRGVDHHALALHPEEHLAHGHLDRAVDVVELGVLGDARVQEAVKLQRDVGVLGGIRGRIVERHLIESDLLRLPFPVTSA